MLRAPPPPSFFPPWCLKGCLAHIFSLLVLTAAAHFVLPFGKYVFRGAASIVNRLGVVPQWLCFGASWNCLCLARSQLLASSHRSHPCSFPTAKYLPRKLNTIYVMLPHTGCWFYTVLHQKHYTELPEGNVSLFHLLCVTVIWLWSFLLWALFFKAAILFSCFMLFVIQTVYTWISLGLTEVQSESTSVSNKVWVTNSAALSKYPGLPIKLLHVWPCCLCFINTPVVTAVCRHCLPHTLNKNDSRWLFITA